MQHYKSGFLLLKDWLRIMTKSKSILTIKQKLLKRTFYRYVFWMGGSLAVLFIIIYITTASFHQKRDENLREINLNFYTEIMMMKNATDNMLAILYTEQPELEDLMKITNLPFEEYYQYKTTAYMENAGSKYSGTQNFINNAFKMNEYLSSVVIYNADAQHSVVFEKDFTTSMKKSDKFKLKETKNVELVKKQIFKSNAEKDRIGFHKELHKNADLSYVADVYFFYDISSLFDKINYQVLRNNGDIKILYRNDPNQKNNQQKYILDQRQTENYHIMAVTKYANVFTEYSLIYSVYCLFALFACLGFFPFIFQHLQKVEGRLSLLTKKITAIKNGYFDTQSMDNEACHKNGDEISLISSSIDEMAVQLNDHIHQVYKSKLKQKDYQIQSIRAQINPHFLYNTLEAIRMKAVLNDDHTVAGMLLNAATLYRNMIKGKDIVYLVEELEYCDAYLSLFEARFEDNLFYDIFCDAGLERLLIEKFTIQPIIENFIHHGIDMKRKDNFIEIHCFEENSVLYIEVVNNGKAIVKEEQQKIQQQLAKNSLETDTNTPTGLFGVDYRIKQRFGLSYGVALITQQDQVKFQLTMPKIEGERLVESSAS